MGVLEAVCDPACSSANGNVELDIGACQLKYIQRVASCKEIVGTDCRLRDHSKRCRLKGWNFEAAYWDFLSQSQVHCRRGCGIADLRYVRQ
jgi:hypothetical protein